MVVEGGLDADENTAQRRHAAHLRDRQRRRLRARDPAVGRVARVECDHSWAFRPEGRFSGSADRLHMLGTPQGSDAIPRARTQRVQGAADGTLVPDPPGVSPVGFRDVPAGRAPGSRMPSILQTLRMWRDPLGFQTAAQARFGEPFGQWFHPVGELVVVSDPGMVRAIFMGDPKGARR